MTRFVRIYVGIVFSLGLLTTPVWAAAEKAQAPRPDQMLKGLQKPSPALPVTLEADLISYDHTTQTVTAKGNVVVEHQTLRLTADNLVYDIEGDELEARDGVKVVDTDGNTFTAQVVVLRNELSEGVIEQLRLSLADDQAWITAEKAERHSQTKATMSRAAFSPCKVCEENPTPLWQIKAQEVKHDTETQNITYNNATFEFMGIPIMWLPYFTHPDPTVERRSGFLIPSFSSNSELGSLVELPYHWAIAPHRDLTFTPVVATKELGFLKGEYRERLYNGEFSFRGSITHVDQRDDFNVKTGRKVVRGHLLGSGFVDLDAASRVGFQLAHTSDDTYLRRYDFSNDETLRSTLYFEDLNGRNFLTIDAHGFQGLRATDDPGQMPLVLPEIDLRKVTEDTYWGGRFYGTANLLALERGEGVDAGRLVAHAGWEASFTLPHGSLVSMGAKVRGRAVYDRDVPDPLVPDTLLQDEWHYSVDPELSVNWSLPFVSPAAKGYHLLEPIASVHLSPIDGFHKEIANNDSIVFELDDTNLFDANRFAGHDRYESGLRGTIGLRYGYYANDGSAITLLLGQSFRTKEVNVFPGTGGLNERESDFVGRFIVNLGDDVNLSHRFRLDSEDLNPLRNEVSLLLSPEDWFELEATYVQQHKSISASGLIAQEEVNAELTVPIVQYWFIRAEGRHDFAPGGGAIRYGAALVYQDECFEYEMGVKRRFTEDRDVRPSTSFGIRVRLRYLGGGGRRD